jgi:O-antigen biosynthesis protein
LKNKTGISRGKNVKEQAYLPVDGETALATPISDDLVLICGVADALPKAVPVLLNGDPSMTMTARVVTWNRPNAPADAAFGFIAVLPIKVADKVRLRSIVIRRNGHPMRRALIRPAVPLADLMQIVSNDAATESAHVAEGVVQILLTGKSAQKHAKAALSILQTAARNDGWIEVMGPLDTGELFLQGWSMSSPADDAKVLVVHDGGLVSAPFISAAVHRADLGGNGQGFIGILDAGNSVDPASIEKLLFNSGDGWRALDVYQQCVHLASTDVPAHIREGLTRTIGKPSSLKTLRRAGERFDGRDTVSSLDHAVRVGMDMAVELPDGGVLVAGWMLDPENLVSSVNIRVGTSSARVDETWTRLSRPDVTTAFERSSLFEGRLDLQRSNHGFLAFVPNLPKIDDLPVYFEFAIGDDAFAFYPLKPVRGLSRRTLERLVAPLDHRTATASTAIDRHIGPMMQSLAQTAPEITEIRDFGFSHPGASKALVLAAGLDAEEVGVTLSLLALDPEASDLPIIVSAPAESFGAIAPEVERLARFYGIAVRLVAADGVHDSCDAYEAAAQVTDADTLILLSAGVLPRQQGWVSALERAFRKRSGKALVSPTILYEDNSICFAGAWLDENEQGIVDKYIGYPRDVIRDQQATEVMAGSTACCIVSRSAFQTAGGFSKSYLSASEKGRDLCLKLRLGGTPSVWLPDVEMISADESSGFTGMPWRRLAQNIDRWSFDRRWSLLINNMR